MGQFELAASILSADFARLGEEAQQMIEAGAHRIHFDVMDNHFVPNLTVGPMVCSALRQFGIVAPIDVHLMVQPISRMITAFVEAGATGITFHPEASSDPLSHLKLIKQAGLAAGLALNPDQPAELLQPFLAHCDELLMMSVVPGFGGQTFMPSVLNKITQVRRWVTEEDLPAIISVDGGINAQTIQDALAHGATRFVAGAALFHGQGSYQDSVKKLCCWQA
ncbi:MAG: ribulose-phosphate 3-epimerase [Alphaproteobacteria bacterium]|nr:ribulose-phosphate 3-epimerase [Alphaproteobacteria bacterium]